MSHPHLRNPHLEGGPFFKAGGPHGVLLIHGLTATTAEVRPLAEHLHGLGYTVAGPLLPGHFARPEDINRYRWQDWARTAADACTELQRRCRRIVVGGESTGALLALLLAADRAEICAALAYAPALQLRMTRREAALVRALAPFVTALPKRHGPPSAADTLWQGYFVNPLKGVRELLRLQAAVRGRLADVRQPILIMQGRLDATVAPDAPVAVHDGVASTDKELHWLAHSTHCIALDSERDQVFATTASFLARVLPPS